MWVSGYLDEVHDFINNMPVTCDAAGWSCLISFCRMHTNLELQEYAAEHIFRLITILNAGEIVNGDGGGRVIYHATISRSQEIHLGLLTMLH